MPWSFDTDAIACMAGICSQTQVEAAAPLTKIVPDLCAPRGMRQSRLIEEGRALEVTGIEGCNPHVVERLCMLRPQGQRLLIQLHRCSPQRRLSAAVNSAH